MERGESKIRFDPERFDIVVPSDTLDLIENEEVISGRFMTIRKFLPKSDRNIAILPDKNKEDWKINWSFFEDRLTPSGLYLYPRSLQNDDLFFSLRVSGRENEPPVFYAASIEDSFFREEDNSDWAMDKFINKFDELIAPYENILFPKPVATEGPSGNTPFGIGD